MMPDNIRVVIADDQTLFLESLATFLRNYTDDIEVIGRAKNGEEAVSMARSLQPDIILMDVHMPVMDGVEATERILQEMPEAKILILSTYDEDSYVRRALGLGASGYLLKDISPTELIASIRALQSGAVQISPQIVSKLMTSIIDRGPTPASKNTEPLDWFEELTRREREVFSLIATGCDNDQIASSLNLAEHTVRNYVSSIYSKLNVQDRFQIIQMASRIRYHE
jgi:DNA-binding NarL/FixJ family response regulator